MIDLPFLHPANVSFNHKMLKDVIDTLFDKKNYI